MPGCSARLLILLFPVLAVSWAHAEEDDYLRALEAEAERIDAPEPPRPGRNADSGVAENRGDRAAFESELQKHKGTYSFYQTLLEKDKAEVYKAYREGASFAKIRKMIISRKLHR